VNNTLLNSATGLYDTTIVNSPTLNTTDYIVGSSSLNSVKSQLQYISLRNKLQSSRVYSFSIWIKTASGDSNWLILFCLSNFDGYNANSTFLNINNNTSGTGFTENSFNGTNATSASRTTKAIKDNAWHHIVWAGVGSSSRQIYLDGITAGAVITGNTYTGGTTGDSSRVIGASWDSLSSMTGQIDDVQIYSGVLTQADVTALYNKRTL
jgi:hypothetical protein